MVAGSLVAPRPRPPSSAIDAGGGARLLDLTDAAVEDRTSAGSGGARLPRCGRGGGAHGPPRR